LELKLVKYNAEFFGTPSPFLASISQKSVKRVTPHPYKK
jgi:hypothetical protein